MEAINKQVEDSVANLEKRIAYVINASQDRMETMIQTALAERFTKSLDKAISQRLKSIFPEV